MLEQAQTIPGTRLPAALVSVFVLALALIYQYAYWSTFDINILQFATLLDLVTFSAWPLMAFFGSYAFAMLFQPALLHPELLNRAAAPNVKGLGIWRATRALLWYWLQDLFLVIGLGAAVFLAGVAREPTFYVVLSLFVGLIAVRGTWLLKLDPLRSTIQNENVRRMATPVLLTLPFLSWGLGKTTADNILSGRVYSEALLPRDVLAEASPGAGPLRYLGTTKDYTFVMSPNDGTVWVLRNDQFAGLRLSKRSSEEAAGPWWWQ